MATPTKEEIKEAIEQLKALKPKIRHKTGFGEDNRAAIDAQVWVLETKADDDEIWDRYPEDEEDMHERDAALEAREWLDGEEVEVGLVESWQELVEED